MPVPQAGDACPQASSRAVERKGRSEGDLAERPLQKGRDCSRDNKRGTPGKGETKERTERKVHITGEDYVAMGEETEERGGRRGKGNEIKAGSC